MLFSRFLLACGCLLSAVVLQPLAAQPSSPVGLPSTDWSAWVEITLPANPLNGKFADPQAAIEVLKLTSDPELALNETAIHSLAPRLWELAKSGQWEMYADAELSKKQDFERVVEGLLAPDTLITFDPQTYEETMIVRVRTEYLPYLATQIIARQLLYYHNSSARFSIQTYAIAPCNADGEPYYWLKVPEPATPWPEDFREDEDISWAVRYTTLDSSPDANTWEEIKNTTGPLIGRLLDRVRPDTNVHIYDAAGDLVRPEDRACFFGCQDTTNVFDPGTAQETIEPASLGLSAQEIEQLQLIEEWCFQDDGTLFTRLAGIAPRYFWIAPLGQTSAWRVAFYRYCDEGSGP